MELQINKGIGYPYGISVRSVATEKETKTKSGVKVIKTVSEPVKELVICHDLKTAIDEYVKAITDRYGIPVDVRLMVLGEKQAPDGVWEQDNEVIHKYRVPVKKLTIKQQIEKK